ncbi:MAG TPA: hypothetical protein DCZ93_09980 [Elusimicrobia bacterium]|nr:hypothetical protein [Elusimicrobiota bacterium]
MHHCKLLIVDDDPIWLKTAVRFFSFKGYRVYSADSCAAGLKLFVSNVPDCVLLDYNLIDGDAEVFCRKVRSGEKLLRTPVVVVSGEEMREMQAYTVCQADAFVLKGSFERITAVVEMVMRRINWERGVIKVGDLKLEKVGFRVLRNSRPFVELSPEQFQLLYLLLQESPEFVSEETISRFLYNSDFAPQNEDSIRGLMQRLRKKLGKQLGRRIKNKSRLGWIYVQPRSRSEKPRSSAEMSTV